MRRWVRTVRPLDERISTFLPSVSTAVTVDPTSRPTSAPRVDVAVSTVRPTRYGRRPAAVRWIVSPSGMAASCHARPPGPRAGRQLCRFARQARKRPGQGWPSGRGRLEGGIGAPLWRPGPSREHSQTSVSAGSGRPKAWRVPCLLRRQGTAYLRGKDGLASVRRGAPRRPASGVARTASCRADPSGRDPTGRPSSGVTSRASRERRDPVGVRYAEGTPRGRAACCVGRPCRPPMCRPCQGSRPSRGPSRH